MELERSSHEERKKGKPPAGMKGEIYKETKDESLDE